VGKAGVPDLTLDTAAIRRRPEFSCWIGTPISFSAYVTNASSARKPRRAQPGPRRPWSHTDPSITLRLYGHAVRQRDSSGESQQNSWCRGSQVAAEAQLRPVQAFLL